MVCAAAVPIATITVAIDARPVAARMSVARARRARQHALLRQLRAVDQVTVPDERADLAQVVNVGERVGVEDDEVRALARLDGADLRKGTSGFGAVSGRGDNRLRGRHAELDEPFDADNRADAVILVLRLGGPR